MTDNEPAMPPQDTGPSDSVERDPLGLSSAEDLDEDRLRVDPLEAGVDPPERWSGVDKYGMTPYEQAHDRPLSERIAEEEPEVQPAFADESFSEEAGAADAEEAEDVGFNEEVLREAEDRSQAADEAGGSLASTQRTPPSPE